MSVKFPASLFVRRRSLLLTAVLGASAAVMSAQSVETAKPSVDLQLPKLELGQAPSYSSSSSSSDEAVAAAPADQLAVNAPHFDFVNAMQYGGGRRGRPRYRGGNTNADGSPKYFGYAGAGLATPDSGYLTGNFAIQGGFGRNFSKKLGVAFGFDYDKFGFTGQTIENQSQLYFGDTAANTQLDGNGHIWSFTLNPTYTLSEGNEGFGAYLVGGGGFYHKTATFFVPSQQCGYDYYGYYTCYAANATLQNYTSNSPGVNGGIGFTYKFSRFSNEKFYLEARVVHTFNTYKPGITVASGSTAINNYTGWNYFPQNSLETTYYPVTVGLRF